MRLGSHVPQVCAVYLMVASMGLGSSNLQPFMEQFLRRRCGISGHLGVRSGQEASGQQPKMDLTMIN